MSGANAVRVRLKDSPSTAVSADAVGGVLREIGFLTKSITFDPVDGSFIVVMPSQGAAQSLLGFRALVVNNMEASVGPYTSGAATSPVEVPQANLHQAEMAAARPVPKKRRTPAQQAVPSAPADPVRAGMQPTLAFSSDHYQYQHPAGNRPAQQTQHTSQIPGQPAIPEPIYGNAYQPSHQEPAAAGRPPVLPPKPRSVGVPPRPGESHPPGTRHSTGFGGSYSQEDPAARPSHQEPSQPSYPASSASQPPLYPNLAEDLRSSKEQESHPARAPLRSPGSHAHRQDDLNRAGDGVELLVSGAPMEKSRNVTMYLKTKHLSGGGGDVELENGLGTPGQMVFRMADAEAAEQVLGKSSHAIAGINNPVTIERFLKMTAPPNAVLVTGIDCSTCADQELVGMVIGAIAKSEPVTVEFDSGVGQAIVTFSEPNTAERACQGDSGDLEMLGASVKVALYQKPVTAPRRPHAPTSFGDAHSQGHPASHPSAMEQSQAGYVSAPLRYGSQLDQDVDFNRAGDGVELLVSGVPMEKSRNVTMYLKTKYLSGGGGDVELENGLGTPGQMVFRMADAEAAEQVLGKSSHAIAGINNPVTIERFLKMTAPPNAVLVTGIDSSSCADQELIGMVIGAIAKCEPVSVECDSGVGQAIVTFSEPNSAERACQGHSGDLEMLGTSVKVALYQKPVTTPRRPHAPTSFGAPTTRSAFTESRPVQASQRANSEPPNTSVLVCGIGKSSLEDVKVMLMILSDCNESTCTVEHYDTSFGEALVSFADPTVADKICRMRSAQFENLGEQVEVTKFNPQLLLLADDLPAADQLKSEILEQYFQRCCKGKTVKILSRHPSGRATIKCQDPSASALLCKTHNVLAHSFLIKQYSVRSTDSTPTGKPSHASRNSTAADHPPNAQARHGNDSEYWKDHLLVTNLPSDFNPESDHMVENLQRFLSNMTGVAEAQVDALQFRSDRALFHISQPFDFEVAQNKCSRTPYSRRANLFVKIRPVKQPRILFCQLLEDVEGPPDSYLRQLFGEGSVAKIEQLTSTMAKVHFHRATDAYAAVSDPARQSQSLCVTQLIEGLHFPAPEDKTANGKSTMKGALPNPVTINISTGLSSFLEQSQAFNSNLSRKLARIRGTSSMSGKSLTVNPEQDVMFLPSWESVAEAMVREALKNYTEEIIDVPDELVDQYADFCEEDQDPDDIRIEFVADDSSLHVTGSSTLVRQCQRKLTKEISKKKKELGRMSDDSISCKTEVVDFLKKYSVIHNICTKAGIPPCTEEANGKSSVTIRLAGPKLKVEAAVKELRQKEQQVALSPALNFRDDDLMAMMSTAKGRQFIEEHFEASAVQWHLKKSAGSKGRMSIVHFNYDEDDIQENIDTLLDKVKAEEIPLTQTQQSIVQTTDFDDCYIQAAMREHGLVSVRIHPNKQRLLISGEAHRVDELVHLVGSYLDKKENVRKVVRLKGQHHLEFLRTGTRATQFAILQSKYTHKSVQVNVTTSRITISGPEKDVRAAEKEFKELAAHFHSERMELSLPGIKDHLSDVANEMELESRKQDVLVNFLSPEEAALDSADEEDDDADVYEFLGNAGQVIDAFRFSAALSNGKRIVLLEGDITATTCSAITNAANEDLQHAGGVAHGISTAGGLSIQRDCNNRVKQYGQVKTGTVYASDVVGALSCKRLVHAVGPRWEGNKSSARRLLQQCVENTLNAASDLDSLALPAISSGIYRFPPDTCAEEIITTVHGWLESNPASALQTVVIVDIKDNILRAMQRLLLKLVPSAADTSRGRKPAPTASRGQTGAVSAAHHGGLLAAVSSAANSARSFLLGTPSATQPAGNAATVGHGGCSMLPGGGGIRSAEGVTISIQRGDITTCKADGIVSSCREDLDLGQSGLAAAAISRVAGSDLQKDCNKYIRQHGTLTMGQFAVTPARKLPAKHVFHGVIPCFDDNASAEQILCGLVGNILADAHSRRLKSIVFPSLGAGNNRYPDHVVANTLLSAAIQFSRNHPQTSLQEVKFCIFDGKVKSAFDSMVTSLCTSSSSMSNVRSGNSAGVLGTTTSTPRSQPAGSSFSYTAPSTPAKTPRIQVGLKQGDIVTETADVIVNSLMTSLEMAEGQMSRSIANAAGRQVQADLNIIKQQQSPNVGDVFTTRPGNLHGCQKIVHAVLAKNCGKQVLEDSVLQCLVEADGLGCSSIAIPALGAGGLGFSSADSAEATIRGIDSFERTKGGTTSLTVINLVIYDRGHVDQFRAALQSRSGSSQPTPPLTRARGRSSVKSNMPNVSVVKGNIVQEQTDAIVTTALASLDMSAAAMSKSVLRDAGDIVQTELSKKKGTVQPGQATSTSAGRLKSKFIIHAVLCPRSGTAGQPFIEDVVTAVLVEAERCKCSSLSIPALGAGGLGFSDKEVSDGTFSAMETYFGGGRKSCITNIKLVMFEAKHVPVFQNACARLLAKRLYPSTSPPAPPSSSHSVPANAQTAEELANTLLTHSASPAVSLNSSSVASQAPDLKTKLKELRQQRVQPLMGQSHPIQTVYFRLIGSSPRATQVMRDRIKALVSGSLLSQSVSDLTIALLSDADDQRIVSEAQGHNVLVTIKSVTEFELTGCKGDVIFVNGIIMSIASEANKRLTEKELAATKQGMEDEMKKKVEQMQVDTMPSIWTTAGKKAFQLVSLVPSSREYKDAVRDFNNTCPAKVTDVARVENPSLYNVFVARCKALADDPCTTATTRILRLFHGSDDDTLEIIYNQGWDKNYAGKNAVYFGKGNYFARDAQFSYKYCGQVKNTKQRRMILALLVLKDTEVGYDGQVAPSQRSADPTQGRISATVDDLSNPSRLVAYEASQSYPAYVLTFNEV